MYLNSRGVGLCGHMYVCMHACMHAWMNEWMNEWWYVCIWCCRSDPATVTSVLSSCAKTLEFKLHEDLLNCDLSLTALIAGVLRSARFVPSRGMHRNTHLADYCCRLPTQHRWHCKRSQELIARSSDITRGHITPASRFFNGADKRLLCNGTWAAPSHWVHVSPYAACPPRVEEHLKGSTVLSCTSPTGISEVVSERAPTCEAWAHKQLFLRMFALWTKGSELESLFFGVSLESAPSKSTHTHTPCCAVIDGRGCKVPACLWSFLLFLDSRFLSCQSRIAQDSGLAALHPCRYLAWCGPHTTDSQFFTVA